MGSTIIQLMVKLAALFLAYFLPVRDLAHGILALFIIDWITGVWNSINQKKRFTSYRLRKSAYKLMGYLIALITSHITETQFDMEYLHLSSIVAGYIALTEFLSILENIASITGKDFLRDIAVKLKNDFITRYFKKGE